MGKLIFFTKNYQDCQADLTEHLYGYAGTKTKNARLEVQTGVFNIQKNRPFMTREIQSCDAIYLKASSSGFHLWGKTLLRNPFYPFLNSSHSSTHCQDPQFL